MLLIYICVFPLAVSTQTPPFVILSGLFPLAEPSLSYLCGRSIRQQFSGISPTSVSAWLGGKLWEFNSSSLFPSRPGRCIYYLEIFVPTQPIIWRYGNFKLTRLSFPLLPPVNAELHSLVTTLRIVVRFFVYLKTLLEKFFIGVSAEVPDCFGFT